MLKNTIHVKRALTLLIASVAIVTTNHALANTMTTPTVALDGTCDRLDLDAGAGTFDYHNASGSGCNSATGAFTTTDVWQIGGSKNNVGGTSSTDLTINITGGNVNMTNINIFGLNTTTINGNGNTLTVDSSVDPGSIDYSSANNPPSDSWVAAMSIWGPLTINNTVLNTSGYAANDISTGIITSALTVTGGSIITSNGRKSGLLVESAGDLNIDGASTVTATSLDVNQYKYGLWVLGNITVSGQSKLEGYASSTNWPNTGILCAGSITVTDSDITGGSTDNVNSPILFGIVAATGFTANAVTRSVNVTVNGTASGLANVNPFGFNNQGHNNVVSGDIAFNSTAPNIVTVNANLDITNPANKGTGIENTVGSDVNNTTPTATNGNVTSTAGTIINTMGKDNAIYATGSVHFDNSTVTAETFNTASDPANYGSVTTPGGGVAQTVVPGFAVIFGAMDTNSYGAKVTAINGSTVTETYNNTANLVTINGTYAGENPTDGFMNNINQIKNYAWASTPSAIEPAARTTTVAGGEIAATAISSPITVTGLAATSADVNFDATHTVIFQAQTTALPPPPTPPAPVGTTAIPFDYKMVLLMLISMLSLGIYFVRNKKAN